MDFKGLHEPQLTLKKAHEYLYLNGVKWHFQYLRTLVWLGKIPSQKIFSSRVVLRKDLDDVIRDRRTR